MPKENNIDTSSQPLSSSHKEDAHEDETDTKEDWEKHRDYHKAEADQAFRSKDIKKAIEEYTTAISFDPDWYILYSNRSPAYLLNGEKSKALADAKKCVELKPDFVKGHSRLASALYSLGRYNEARNVYKHILTELDPNHIVSKKGLDDCRSMEQQKQQSELEMLRRSQEQAKQTEEMKLEKDKDEKNQKDEKSKEVANNISNEEDNEEDDLLNDFFDEVEDVQVKKKPLIQDDNTTEPNSDETNNEKKENKIQIQLTDLGDTKTQIQRLLCSNHEWYNLNPFRVLDISHEAPMDLLSRRYKALSLLLHPDKVRASNNNENDTIEQAEQAFEYVRKAINILKDEDKLRHMVDLIEQGIKQGKRDYEVAKNQNATAGKDIEKYQEIATMKIFAEIERKRRDVERRKRKYEERERQQEDDEVNKTKKEFEFEKNWKEEGRVEKRINNWRDFKKQK